MELPDAEERRISYVAVTRAKKALDIGDNLKWIFDVTSDEDEKPETIEIEKLIGMSVTPDPEPVTPEEIGNKVIKDRKITDAKTLEVANKLIELIEKGVVPWTKGWSGGNLKNPKTNHTFQGSNVLALWAAMAENNWSDPRFLNFNQAKAMGGFVRKGEKGTTILKPNKVVKEVKQKDGTLKKEGYIWFSTEAYFNVSQIENVEFPPLVKKEPVPILEIETQILESYKDHPEIIYRPQNSAFYRPSEDKIYLPQREQFDSSMTFIETLFHELGHSTGHISRLGKEGKRKDLQDNYGDHRASRGEEELIAEITVALIAAEFGVEIDWGNTASYAEGWLKPLKDDPGMIIVAARQAQDSVNWMLGIKPEDRNAIPEPDAQAPEAGEGVGSEGQTGEEIADQAPETPEATPEPNVGEQGQTGEEIANKTPKNKDASVEPTKFTFSGEEYDLWDDITYDRESDRGIDNEGLENGHGIFATRLLDGQELITDRTEINNYITEILKKYGYGNKFFMLASAAVSDKSLGKDPMQNGGGIEAGIGRANNSLIPEGNPLREIEFPVFLARSRGISKVAMLHEIAHLMEAGWRTGIGGGHNMIWHQTFLTLLRQEGFKKEANLLALTIGEVKGDTGAINP
jgi:antirestriction protein ArdC